MAAGNVFLTFEETSTKFKLYITEFDDALRLLISALQNSDFEEINRAYAHLHKKYILLSSADFILQDLFSSINRIDLSHSAPYKSLLEAGVEIIPLRRRLLCAFDEAICAERDIFFNIDKFGSVALTKPESAYVDALKLLSDAKIFKFPDFPRIQAKLLETAKTRIQASIAANFSKKLFQLFSCWLELRDKIAEKRSRAPKQDALIRALTCFDDIHVDIKQIILMLQSDPLLASTAAANEVQGRCERAITLAASLKKDDLFLFIPESLSMGSSSSFTSLAISRAKEIEFLNDISRSIARLSLFSKDLTKESPLSKVIQTLLAELNTLKATTAYLFLDSISRKIEDIFLIFANASLRVKELWESFSVLMNDEHSLDLMCYDGDFHQVMLRTKMILEVLVAIIPTQSVSAALHGPGVAFTFLSTPSSGEGAAGAGVSALSVYG